jgi:hypothetical protein
MLACAAWALFRREVVFDWRTGSGDSTSANVLIGAVETEKGFDDTAKCWGMWRVQGVVALILSHVTHGQVTRLPLQVLTTEDLLHCCRTGTQRQDWHMRSGDPESDGLPKTALGANDGKMAILGQIVGVSLMMEAEASVCDIVASS